MWEHTSGEALDQGSADTRGCGDSPSSRQSRSQTPEYPNDEAITYGGGFLLNLEHLDDWQVVSVEVAIGKARTAVIFYQPTSAFDEVIKNDLRLVIAADEFTPLQGGVPIIHDGSLSGAIGISGRNPPRGEKIARVGADALHGGAALVTALAVTLADSQEVETAFASGWSYLALDSTSSDLILNRS